MGTDEKSKLLVEFMNQNNTLKEVLEVMKAERSSFLDYKTKFEEEHKQNLSLQARMDKLLETIGSLREQLDLMNRHTYGSKTQKRKPGKSKAGSVDHTKEKDDFDGTPGSIGMDSTSASASEEPGKQSMEKADKEARHYRQGMEYRTMKADKTVCHLSDLNRLPAGATVIKVLHRYSYEQISSIFLAYLAFNKYVLNTPLYRELARVTDEQMQVSRMTLTNWFEKKSKYVNGLIKILKDNCCCLPHARAKFKYASEQGGDKDADFFLDAFGELYHLEAEYEKGKLSAGQIKACRQHFKTKEIIIKIRSKLDAMLSDIHPPRGDLMEKALNYLNTFWTQLFAYTKDGSYTIDNSIAERFIRPLSGERKNSLFFGSDKMARVSAAYHTIISTCKMQGVSALQYFKMFFREIVNGRRDYQNLLPMTIGLGNNKL